MAGSYRHVTDERGLLREGEAFAGMIENLDDAYEAVREMYGMIWLLADGDPARVEDAWARYADAARTLGGGDAIAHRLDGAATRGIHPLARVGGPPEDLAWRERHERDGCRCYPAVISPTAWINAYATVDGGTAQPTVVEAGACVFAHAHVGHDARIEAGATITTGAIIGGHARIGAHAKVGLNAVVLPHRTVGEGAEIGALAVVTKDVPAGEVWAGNPARPLPAGKNPVPYTERR